MLGGLGFRGDPGDPNGEAGLRVVRCQSVGFTLCVSGSGFRVNSPNPEPLKLNLTASLQP